MKEEKMRTRLFVTESGQQVVVEDLPEASISFVIQGDNIKEEHDLNVSEQGIKTIKSNLKTHKVKFDTIKGKISIVPKEKVEDEIKPPIVPEAPAPVGEEKPGKIKTEKERL